jgi:hypothetical protein
VTSWWRQGGGGALHAMAATSEVDGSWRWTPHTTWDGAGAARQSRRADDNGRKWGKRSGVEERALPVWPNRYASLGTRVFGPHTWTDVLVKALSSFYYTVQLRHS